jgi:hypothetical protein
MIFRLFAAVTALALAVGAPAIAQMPVADHLQCYKVKDTSMVLKGTVGLDDTLSGALAPCKISTAKLFCTPSKRTAATVFNITSPIMVNGHTGIEIPADQNRLCYKVSCPKLDPPEANVTVTDAFGPHALTKLKTGMVCTPTSSDSSYCGDGNVDANEDCDGTDLHGGTCVTAGLGSGTLACGPGCRYDTSGCVDGAFPASGQTTCYNATGSVIACAGTGQDGEKQAGATLAYQDNGDGTVTDLNTGLMWEKQSDDNSIHDRDTLFTAAAAPGHITTLNSGNFANHNDWRMPNARELLSLVNYGVANPAIEASAFHTNCFGGCTVSNCSCTAFFAYWTGTTVTNLPNAAFTVNFTDGTVNASAKNASFTAAVRGVRGGPQ